VEFQPGIRHDFLFRPVHEVVFAKPTQPHPPNTMKHSSHTHSFRLVILVVAAAVLFSLLSTGCTHRAARRQKLDARLVEAARVNNEAARQALDLQPFTNRDACSETARAFVSQNQRVLGSPVHPLPVPEILAQVEQARSTAQSNSLPVAPGIVLQTAVSDALREPFAAQDRMLGRQRAVVERLTQMGAEAESTRNEKISFWARWIGRLTLPVAGLIALMVFVPAAIPILGRLLAWLVGKLPTLAGYVGVVGTNAFDATVKGIETWKQSSAAGQPAGPTAAQPPALLNALSQSMDGSHKALVRARRNIVTR
jgi:hypothetical protein